MSRRNKNRNAIDAPVEDVRVIEPEEFDEVIEEPVEESEPNKAKKIAKFVVPAVIGAIIAGAAFLAGRGSGDAAALAALSNEYDDNEDVLDGDEHGESDGEDSSEE